MYKIGLLVNIGSSKTTDINIVFCYEQNHFVIKYFHDQRIADILSNPNTFISNLPILYKDTKEQEISNYILLSEIQYIEDKQALTNKGLELLAADTHVTYFDKNQGKLFNNGLEICNENPEYYFKTKRTDLADSGPSIVIPERLNNNLNQDFSGIVSNIILRMYCLGKVIGNLTIKNNINLIFNIKDIKRKRLKENHWLTLIRKYKSYLDTVDFPKILQSYKVSYHYSYIQKKEEYKVYREAETDNKEAYNDIFLKELLGLGGQLILECDSLQDIDIKMGEYQGEDLVKEKEKVQNEYSKEVHLACLLAHDLYQRKLNQTGIKELEIQRNSLKDILFHYFKLDCFDQRDFYSFGNKYEIYGNEGVFESKLNEVNKKYSSTTLLSK